MNVEYVSANPTGPLHAAHARGAVLGDALAGLLSFCGWKVTREYYTNDAGNQVDVLARSAYLRYREALGEDIGEIRLASIRAPICAMLVQHWRSRLATNSCLLTRKNGWCR